MIQEFTNYLRVIRGYSPNTVKAYEKDCRQFASYIRAKMTDHPRWSGVTRQDIDDYMKVLVDNGRSGATINRHLASISAIYKYMRRQGYPVENPCRLESRHKLPARLPQTINIEELREALKHAPDDVAMMIRLFISTGIRVQELIDIDTRDVEWEQCRMKVHGKGAKERYVYMDEDTRDKFLDYAHGIQNPFGMWSQRDIRRELYNALFPYCRARQLSPHAIRHTFATQMAKNGVPTTTLASLMGHNQLKTTQKYIDLGQTNIEEQYIDFKPWN